MSYKALAWAAEQKCGSPTAKAVLIALASFADDQGVCWPSQQSIAERAEIAREAANRIIPKLVEAGLVVKDLRRGRIVYFLKVTNSNIDTVISAPAGHVARPQMEPVSVSEGVIEDHSACDRQSQSECDRGSQVEVEVCATITGGVIEDHSGCDRGSQPSEPVKNQSRNQSIITPPSRRGSAVTVSRPPDVSEEAWADYATLRKAKRSPLTQTALDSIRREAEKAGWTLQRALDECCCRGWLGFKAEWVMKNGGTGNVKRSNGIGYQASAVEGVFAGFARAKVPDDVSGF